MTSITRNLPWFVRDLGVSVIGKECYTSLIEDLNFSDVQCIKYSISKGLGIGIVVGGSIMKVPQLLLIVKAKSARGLSLPAYLLETLSYAITLVYSHRNGFPFSTYGENLFLTLQNIAITLLIILYAPRSASSDKTPSAIMTFLALSVFFLGTALAPPSILALLQLTTLPLSLFSKLPQIRQNYSAQSTGQLSAFAVISQVAGTAARLFTTATEVSDPIIVAGFGLALVLNLILGAQLWMFWGKDASNIHVAVGEKPKTRLSPAPEIKAATGSAVPAYESTPTWQQRAATPPPGGRKWARKVE
ncbi:Mannose-P-dolichol utilization defect 1 protein-like protein [Mycena indigotica]|uniref:Mannose-P-dolichol utilization defect 1 protein-like protein n=1 Tax=Mycena indigotica TaxID=2126181 RepID=A0A8H6TDY3_9AGAR|nr:Mannose-P-dolichol utilization defect 1 protein-like protein [Mycena indigotica]KAF7315908.1 Mannose-P-dolichol utilization defect 1 protein-like protein [Mycena indigotica]